MNKLLLCVKELGVVFLNSRLSLDQVFFFILSLEFILKIDYRINKFTLLMGELPSWSKIATLPIYKKLPIFPIEFQKLS